MSCVLDPDFDEWLYVRAMPGSVLGPDEANQRVAVAVLVEDVACETAADGMPVARGPIHRPAPVQRVGTGILDQPFTPGLDQLLHAIPTLLVRTGQRAPRQRADELRAVAIAAQRGRVERDVALKRDRLAIELMVAPAPREHERDRHVIGLVPIGLAHHGARQSKLRRLIPLV